MNGYASKKLLMEFKELNEQFRGYFYGEEGIFQQVVEL